MPKGKKYNDIDSAVATEELKQYIEVLDDSYDLSRGINMFFMHACCTCRRDRAG